jgi:phenylacetic acid degradation operon negative regulatory protein
LLPARWTGRQAAEVFDTESARLLPAASRFVDSCLRPGTPGVPSRPAPSCLGG